MLIIDLKARTTSRASATLLPFTAWLIMDAELWLIEQPCPPMRMSPTVSEPGSPSSRR
jgi:hypothetical protein